MRHPYEKFIRIELMSMVCAALIGIIVLLKGYLLFIFMCFLLIALSLLTEAMILWFTYQKIQGGKQLFRALIILMLTIYLMFKW